eukprot:TRINITY_DN334_c0_g1_i4.p2 TRINITY_DN334_c0_g1~~TRINITY_DN334_c0_g1_i4.p2  ORF type:complete len:120 (-),score=77.93 TRINITY_DN334_c0_g1_i4:3-362(-)
MKYLAAYALLVLSGKENPTEADVENLLKEVGIKTDKAQLKVLMEAVQGKKLHELIAAGMNKIQTVGSAPAGGAAAAVAKDDEKKGGKKEKKEEKKEEEKKEEEDALEGGLNLFGDEDEY